MGYAAAKAAVIFLKALATPPAFAAVGWVATDMIAVPNVITAAIAAMAFTSSFIIWILFSADVVTLSRSARSSSHKATQQRDQTSCVNAELLRA